MLTSGTRSRNRRLPATILTIAVALAAVGCSAGDSARPTRPTGTAAATVSSTGAGLLVQPTPAAPSPVPEAGSPAPHPTFPAVVALTWLDGASTESALRIDTGDFILWQGSTPGEQAELLPGGAYRWVGPDGSMVGCAGQTSRRLHCVGVDSAGNTAVTSRTDGPRAVYRPDGRWYGEFRSDGTPIAESVPPITLARAVAESGVDMASLVDFATGRPPFAGGVTGDPHLVTMRGIRVTTQQAGDYWARSADQAHQIQIRVQPMPYQSDVSYVTAVAAGLAGHRLEFSLTGTLSIDGAAVTDHSAFHLTTVADGPTVGLWPPDSNGVVEAMVLWPDGSTVFMSADSSLGLTLITRLPGGPFGGLFGPMTAGSADQVVDSWRVQAGQSLFADSAPPSEGSSGPPGQISPAATLSAENSCAAAHMANSGDLAACIFDVARTGDDGYVMQHAELAAAATPPVVPNSLAGDWPALTLGKASSPETLNPGTRIAASVAAGARRLYRITLNAGAGLLITATDCPGTGTGEEADRGAAALRVFDDAGHPVSARRPGCGQGRTGPLAPGTYYLLLAGPQNGAAATFRLLVGLD